MGRLILLAWLGLGLGLAGCGVMDHCFFTDDNQTCSVTGHRMP